MQFSLSLKVCESGGQCIKLCPSQVHWHEEMDVTAEAERANQHFPLFLFCSDHQCIGLCLPQFGSSFTKSIESTTFFQLHLTNTIRKNILVTIWTYLNAVKLTYKINHRSLQILLLSLTFKQHFLKTFRPSHMTAHSPYLSSELRGGGTESHLQSVWEEIAGGQGRTAEGISDSGWEFRGRNLSIHHSVPAFQAHSFLLKYFKQHCFEAHDQSVVVQEVISA